MIEFLKRYSFIRNLKIYIRKVSIQAKFFEFNERTWRKMSDKYLFDLLCYAKMHSRYYAGLIPNFRDKSDVKKVLFSLPLLTKDIIREQKEYIYSDEILTKKHGWANTGGSTGEPLRFPEIVSNHYHEPLCQMMLYRQMGVNVLYDLIISIDGTRIDQADIEKNIYWKESPFNFPYGKYSLSTFYMSEDTIPYYIRFLNHIKPHVMRGYPSGIVELANYCRKFNVSFSFPIKGIYLTSENFGKEEEKLISGVFCCPVWGQYGHTEASVFAVKKPNEESYVCCPLYGYTEVLDDNGSQVKKGQIGEIVVSGFNHYGLPFIRYKTGDLAEYGGMLSNGSVVLNKLLGRSVDFLINMSGEKIYLVGFIFGGHLKAFNYIKQWQLEQSEKGVVSMKIVKGIGYTNQIEQEIVDLFASKSLSVSIIYTDNIKKTGRGKMKFLIQHLN